jgi:Sulfite oxidase and related enzymes
METGKDWAAMRGFEYNFIKGARLSALLEGVSLKPNARYVVFHCADPMEEDGSSPYYESIDLEDAFHPQTILAYELNGKPLPIQNGAPLRLRLERQLGYKMAKYVMRIEIVEDLSRIADLPRILCQSIMQIFKRFYFSHGTSQKQFDHLKKKPRSLF